jgi:hypothetical protein
VDLHALTRQRRRTGQCLSPRLHSSGNPGAPPFKIIRHLELNGSELDSPHVPDELGESCRPATSLTTEDNLQRLSLALVGPFVEEDSYSGLRLPRPNISSKGTEGEHV